MTTLLLSPAELAGKSPLAGIGPTSPLPELYGVDVMWSANDRLWGVQRKEFPGDFTSSRNDGRLAREIQQMASLTGGGALVLEGMGDWTTEGQLVNGGMTYGQLLGKIWSMTFLAGIAVIRVAGPQETAPAVWSLVEWSQKKAHYAIRRRPVPDKPWGELQNEDYVEWVYQGVQGWGPVIARDVREALGAGLFKVGVSREELLAVKGLGKGRVDKFLEVWGDEWRPA